MSALRLAAAVFMFTALTASAHADPAKTAPAKPGYSKAYDACMAGALSTLAMNDCNAGELQRRDAALNAAYAKALGRANDATDAFKAAERAWIAYRDADCGVYANRDAFGSLGSVEAGTCLIDRTIERTNALKAFNPY